MNSNQKGKRGERELASKIRECGFDARRGQQYCGSNGDADVVGLDGVHIECKRVEHLNLEDAMSQSKHDAKDGEVPIVAHRKNNCSWKVTMEFTDWIEMYKEWYKDNNEL